MKKNTSYESPKIDIHLIELEHGIAVGSATAQFRGPSNETPQVDGWNLNPNDGSDNPTPNIYENW